MLTKIHIQIAGVENRCIANMTGGLLKQFEIDYDERFVFKPTISCLTALRENSLFASTNIASRWDEDRIKTVTKSDQSSLGDNISVETEI